MNHLDVGYNGSYSKDWIHQQRAQYLLYGVATFPEQLDWLIVFFMDSGFIYTTHSWLLYLYLNCPKNFVLNNVTLYCPTPEEVGVMASLEEWSCDMAHWTNEHAGGTNDIIFDKDGC